MTREHTTHFDDCGCLSERYQQELDKAKEELARKTALTEEFIKIVRLFQSAVEINAIIHTTWKQYLERHKVIQKAEEELT